MKSLFAVALIAIAAPALAEAPAPQPTPSATAPTAKFNLDTPIMALAADEKAKAVIVADLPDLLPHPSYEMFKGMSLRQVAPYSQGMLTDTVLAKVEADLATIK